MVPCEGWRRGRRVRARPACPGSSRRPTCRRPRRRWSTRGCACWRGPTSRRGAGPPARSSSSAPPGSTPAGWRPTLARGAAAGRRLPAGQLHADLGQARRRPLPRGGAARPRRRRPFRPFRTGLACVLHARAQAPGALPLADRALRVRATACRPSTCSAARRGSGGPSRPGPRWRELARGLRGGGAGLRPAAAPVLLAYHLADAWTPAPRSPCWAAPSTRPTWPT